MPTFTLIRDEATPALANLHAKLQDLTPFVLEVGKLISKQMEYNFGIAAWPPLAVSTIAQKTLEGWPLDILVRTGAMRNAAVSGAWTGAANRAVLEVPGYSAFHFEGTAAPMPARDYAFIPSSIEPEIQAAFHDFIEG